MVKLSSLRRKIEEDEGTWFVSLADMLTLLLCFFMLMLSVSSLDQERYKQVAQSLEQSLTAEKAKRAEELKKAEAKKVRQSLEPFVPTGTPGPVIPSAMPPGTVEQPAPAETPPQPAAASKSVEDIRKELAARFALDQSAVQVESREAGVAITMKGAVLFDKASADLSHASKPYLDSIAASLRATPYTVMVEGHTDNLPIQSFIYPSNWELSAARASRVARYLIDLGVPKERIQVVGLADTKPLVPNTDDKGQPLAENQARNRRVVIVVKPDVR